MTAAAPAVGGVPGAGRGRVVLCMKWGTKYGPEYVDRLYGMVRRHLAGDRRGTWSLTVTRNWRLTFRIDRTTNEIVDLDYEDYH